MLKLSKLAAASVVSALVLGAQAFAQGTFVPVAEPADALSGASALGINDKGEVAGSYLNEDGLVAGFSGTIDGDYETYTFDGQWTQPRGINNKGTVVGYYRDPFSGFFAGEFVRDKNGNFTTVTKDGDPTIGIFQGINEKDEFVGDYLNVDRVPARGAFRGEDGEWTADIDLPFPTVRSSARAINNQGDIVGWFISADDFSTQGFKIAKDGTVSVFVYPGSSATFAQGINAQGQISGTYRDNDGILHGFMLDNDMTTWTSIDAPGAVTTQGWQINNLGQVVVSGSDGTKSISFIYCSKNGGVCSGKDAVKANTSQAIGQGALSAPFTGNGNGPINPDDAPRKLGHQM